MTSLDERVQKEDYSMKVYLELMHDIFDSRGLGKDRWDRYVKWLSDTDFDVAPASSRYHGCYRGGLLEHHLDMYNETIDLLELEKFKDVRHSSAYLVVLTHDYCKIGLYEEYDRNVKNETTGQWEKVKAYRYGKPQFPLGHGVTSAYLVDKLIPLNLEEYMAIRWHMGEYNCCDNEMSDLQEARDRYPLVLLTQMADRLSITSY